MENFFKLKENGTNVRTEVIAGLSTFMTMAYIVALNPNLLTNFAVGTSLWNAVFMATVLSAAVGTFLMAFLANKPFALAPGMGLNAYFATIVAAIAVAAGITYEEAFGGGLAIILISGILFTVLTVLKVREKIVSAIPNAVRLGIPAGIGFMLINVGLTSNAGLYTDDGGYFTMLESFFTDGPSATAAAMGELYSTMIVYVLTMFVGVIVIAVMSHKKSRGAVLIGMVAASVFYWICSFVVLGVNPFISLATASFVPPFADMLDMTFFKFNFSTLFSLGYFSALMTVVSFCMVDMFDTIGTLIGTAKRAKMVDAQGEMPDMNKAMLSDSVATCVGACTGTSTVTTFIESSAGVEAGGRTGLTAFTTGVMFLACMFIAPIAALVPAPATSAALVYVGVLMMSSLKEVDYEDITQTVPVALCLLFMIVTGGIATGIGIGLISYTVLKYLIGEGKDVSVVTVILSLLFLGKFFIVF